MSNGYWTRHAGRQTSRRRFLAGAGTAALGSAAIAAGCGDDDDTSGTPTSAGTATASPSGSATQATSTAGTPKPGGVYRTANTLAGSTLDHHRELYPVVPSTAGLAYNNIVAWDDIDKGTVKGELATALPEQPDNLTYVFTIRDNVKWHNKAPANGRALNMDDIKWNIERNRGQKTVNGETAKNFYLYGPIYSQIDSVAYTDATHLTIKLKTPNPSWLFNMADQFNAVEYKELMEELEGSLSTFDAKYIVGTGPYVFDEYSPPKRAHGVRNPDYFLKSDSGGPFFDEIIWANLGADINSIRAAFEQKQIDIMSAQKDVIDAVSGSHAELKKIQVANPNNNLEIHYNYSTNPALSNPMIRQAIFLAVDRSLMAQQAYQGIARPSPAIPWAFSEWALPQTELAQAPGYRADKTQDLTDARALWNAGGGAAIDPSQLQFIINDQMDQSIKEWWPAMMNKNLATDKFSLRTVAVSALLGYLTNRSADGKPSKEAVGYLGPWANWNSPEPRSHFYDFYGKAGNANFYQAGSPEMEDLLLKMLAEFDVKKAKEHALQAQRVALKDGGSGHFQMVAASSQYLYWPYLHREGPTFVAYEKQLGRKSWLDTTDPSFKGRPS